MDETRQIESNSDARLWATLSHLLAIFTGFIGPLIIWLVKKDEHPFVDDQAKESLNFEITMLIGYLIAGVLWCFIIGMFFSLAIYIFQLVFCIIATMKSNSGEWYRYPLNLRIIK